MPLLFVVTFSRDDDDDPEMGGVVMVVVAAVVFVFASLLTGVKNAEELVDVFPPLSL